MSSSKGPSRPSSHSAFSTVDELVSKPVLGSDGAASWQNFRSSTNTNKKSVAPRAPLKKADKLGTGFTNWKEEEEHEKKMRESSGHSNLHSGYTNFAIKKDGSNKKEIENIEARIRPESKEYYIASETFTGWKFDYVFTTRKGWGVGYFWDGTDSVKKLHGVSLPDDATTAETTKTNDDSKDQNDKKKTKKEKKKKRKRQGPVIVEDPNNPREQIAAAFQRRREALANGGASNNNDLPDGWEAAHDASSQKTYYYNRATGERAWEKPGGTNGNGDGDDTKKKDGNDSKKQNDHLPDGWSEAKDPNNGNKTYYYHTDGRTSWERPK